MEVVRRWPRSSLRTDKNKMWSIILRYKHLEAVRFCDIKVRYDMEVVWSSPRSSLRTDKNKMWSINLRYKSYTYKILIYTFWYYVEVVRRWPRSSLRTDKNKMWCIILRYKHYEAVRLCDIKVRYDMEVVWSWPRSSLRTDKNKMWSNIVRYKTFSYKILRHKSYEWYESDEKATTLQPENRQEQDVVFYLKI